MAFLQMSYKSKVLGMQTGIQAILPHEYADVPAGGYPVVFLLHGISHNATNWTRFSSIERYANERGIAVILPEVQRSFYTDMRYGLSYFTYIAGELPAVSRALFPISAKREKTFVAGMSMGGYGAFKCALRCPETYAAAASLSGMLDVERAISELNDQAQMDEIYAMTGACEHIKPEDDLFVLAARTAEYDSGDRPRLFFCCGTEDFLYGQNETFRVHLDAIGVSYRYEDGPGAHNWVYWDTAIQNALDFFGEML